MAALSISPQDLSTLTPADVKDLATRLERDEYSSPFDGLKDWHVLRALAFQRPELVEPYFDLLEFEACDDD
ncbi:MAG TPA: DUF2555 domain-containing protein [Oscillatoriales cyanobacterium M59_W2019_021]|nr:MAG: DUF2555 domain-containing protein [Cyanobacteria bacterium J055]HIK32220.1 DUF2555 domain-containing protein [Oscillatoriales cyanobacterium M4454_W2019_049]HIK52279.1 DUF2555 domain-containing protein [Oscillatoriales cyanobacterium M59_W2019_021]